MSNKIQIRRSDLAVAPAAGSLAKGEMAWVDHGASQGAGGANGILYIGDVSSGTAIVRTVGGTLSSQYTLDLLTDTALTGTPTAPTQLVSTAPSNQVATSQYVDDRIAQSGGAFETLTDTLFANKANGHLAIFDADAGVWENKAAGGDVTLDKEGVILVNSVQAGAISPDTDFNTTYVSDVTGTANEVEVTPTDVGVNRTIQVGLPNDVTITGNLTVNGSTTTVDSTVVSLADPVFVIGDNVATQDRGIEYKDSDGSDTQGYFGFSRAQNAFTYIPDATNTSEVFTGLAGDAVFANITGTLTTAVQPNVTTAANLETVGDITTGAWKSSTLISSEFGGTGINSSAATGVGIVTGGTWSTPSTLPQSFGGTGLSADAAAGAILVGGGAGNSMTTLTVGAAGQHLTMNGAGTAPEWSDEVDGGTF